MSVKFGIIGPGSIARSFASGLNIVDGVELYAVASRDLARAEKFKEDFSATKAYGSYDELLDDPEVNSVYVALPHNHHYATAKKALQKGKNVICEKPLVLTEADCEDLFATAKENNVLLMEAMWTYCLPSTKKVKEWIANGAVGQVNHIDSSFCFDARNWDPDLKGRLFVKELAGGALYDLGIYTLAYPIGVLGELPVECSGMCRVGSTGVDFSNSTMLKFPNDIIATATSSVATAGKTICEIFGDKGSIVVNSFYNSKECELYDLQHNLVEKFVDTGYEEGFCYEVEHFRDLVLAGKKESDLVTPEITLTCAKIMETLMTSWGIN